MDRFIVMTWLGIALLLPACRPPPEPPRASAHRRQEPPASGPQSDRRADRRRGRAEPDRQPRPWRDRLQRCYLGLLRTDPGLQGTVLVRVHVAPDGVVARVQVLRNTSHAPRLAACLVDIARTWRFSKAPDDPSGWPARTRLVEVPIVFRPPNY